MGCGKYFSDDNLQNISLSSDVVQIHSTVGRALGFIWLYHHRLRCQVSGSSAPRASQNPESHSYLSHCHSKSISESRSTVSKTFLRTSLVSTNDHLCRIPPSLTGPPQLPPEWPPLFHPTFPDSTSPMATRDPD